jgi:hypothetical protein
MRGRGLSSKTPAVLKSSAGIESCLSKPPHSLFLTGAFGQEQTFNFLEIQPYHE